VAFVSNADERSKRNRRTVIVLFLVAAAFYFGFIAMTGLSK
jgi:hypothetical protein